MNKHGAKKWAHFDEYWGLGWPELTWLEPYFLGPPERRWFSDTGNDSAGLSLQGIEGTSHLELGLGRVDIELMLWGNPNLGVLLIYSKSGGHNGEDYSSKGDITRIREWVRSTHGDPLPIGLFIPFEKAWLAVKEFIKTEGELPTSIEWIANRDLPPNTFPDP
ncbi:Imm1 family immunity protein [Afipia sp. P52-10]|uniref:Imm1 family immunity protein n=1 Tax=Afipia sp. P52-10 TaxID=1429916 RepID=UPI0013646B8A|nr:Imm1 family immunity protein [Afipia sp. P52-10]